MTISGITCCEKLREILCFDVHKIV